MAAENKPEDDHGNSNGSHVKIFLPKKLLECLPKCSSLPKERHRWNTNETAIISDEKAEFFRSKLTNKIRLLHFLQLALMIVGSLMFLGFLFAFFICKGRNPK